MDYLIGKARSVDPKIVAVAVGYLLTLAVVKLGLDINAVLIPGYLTVNGAIALAGGLAAGYWKANVATILRTEQEDGNPDPSLLGQNGYGEAGLIVGVLLIILLVLLILRLA